jgi:hypothetical protein
MTAADLDNHRATEPRLCPRCRRECRPDETVCLYCDQDLSKPALPRLGIGQFSVAFLLGVMATAALTLGIYRWSANAAIALWMVILPALVRTAVAAYLRRRRGGQYSGQGLGIAFLVSLAAMIPVLTIAFAAFLLGCGAAMLLSPYWLGMVEADARLIVLFIGGATAFLGAGYGFWITRPHE